MRRSGEQLHPTEPEIKLRWRQRTLLDRDTEEDGNDDKYHHPRSQNGYKNLPEADWLHTYRSVPLKLVCEYHDDLALLQLLDELEVKSALQRHDEQKNSHSTRRLGCCRMLVDAPDCEVGLRGLNTT